MMLRSMLAGALLTASALANAADDRFGPDDLARLGDVAEPALSPDGRQLVISSQDTTVQGAGSTIYILPVAGGEPRRDHRAVAAPERRDLRVERKQLRRIHRCVPRLRVARAG